MIHQKVKSYSILSLILLMILPAISTFAQENKTTIAVIPFSCTKGYEKYVPELYDLVVYCFVQAGRFNIVDRNAWKQLTLEREHQKGEEFLNSKIAEQGKSLGAEFIVKGNLTSLTVNKKDLYNSSGGYTGTNYTAYISASLSVINVSTGQTINTLGIMESNSNIFEGSSSVVGALDRAARKVRIKTEQWIGKAFPVTVKVVKILEQTDKKGVTKLLIAGGQSVGIKDKKDKNDMRIVMYEDTQVGDKTITRTVEIGTGRVTKIEDDNFSQLSILSNGLDVLAKFNEGKTLFAITTE